MSQRKIANQLVLTIGALFFAASACASSIQGSFETITGTGSVYRVIDGDTFIINVDETDTYNKFSEASQGEPRRLRYFNDNYQSIRVRLANVDTPESVHSDNSLNTEEGRRISEEVKALLEGNSTLISCFDLGYYGRAI